MGDGVPAIDMRKMRMASMARRSVHEPVKVARLPQVCSIKVTNTRLVDCQAVNDPSSLVLSLMASDQLEAGSVPTSQVKPRTF